MHDSIVRSGRSRAALAATLCVTFVAVPSAAHAQLPGLPVLQNAFGSPGLTGAINVGSGDGGATYALSGSYGLGRFLLSGGIGAVVPDSGKSRAGYGVRLAMPLLQLLGGAAGVAAFAGAGGSSSAGMSSVQLPLGAGIGWRRGLGATRGVSVYAAPMYTIYRTSGGDESQSAGLMRASIGLDFAVTQRLGVTIGAEGGQKAQIDEPGPTGGVAGLGVAWSFGRR